jgi:ankyrin repeat protein
MGGTWSSVGCWEPGATGSLLAAASEGDVETVRQRVKDDPKLLIQGGVGLQDTCWHLAGAYGQLRVLEELWQLLLDHKEQLAKHFSSRKHTVTPDEIPSMVINKLNSKGQSALMFACFASRPEAVKLLLQKVCGWLVGLSSKRCVDL